MSSPRPTFLGPRPFLLGRRLSLLWRLFSTAKHSLRQAGRLPEIPGCLFSDSTSLLSFLLFLLPRGSWSRSLFALAAGTGFTTTTLVLTRKSTREGTSTATGASPLGGLTVPSKRSRSDFGSCSILFYTYQFRSQKIILPLLLLSSFRASKPRAAPLFSAGFLCSLCYPCSPFAVAASLSLRRPLS